DGAVGVEPHLLVAGDRTVVGYAARVGVRYRARNETVERIPLGTEITWGIAAGAHLAKDKLLVGPEAYGAAGTSSSATRSYSAELLVTGKYAVARGWRVGAGAGIGLSKAFGTPAARLLVGAEWVMEPT